MPVQHADRAGTTFLRMHRIVTRLAQAHQVVNVICSIGIYLHRLNVMHNLRRRFSPIPQAFLTQLLVAPSDLFCDSPPLVACVIQ